MRTNDMMEWYSAEELHTASQSWLVELEFIKNEHLFFEDLATSFTLQLVEVKGFEKNNKMVDALNNSKRKNELLIKEIKMHDKDLKLLVDAINQPKEESNYRKEHKALMAKVGEYLIEYKSLKTQLFAIFKDVFKREKQKRLMA